MELIDRDRLLEQLGISERFNADIPAWVIGVIKGMPEANEDDMQKVLDRKCMRIVSNDFLYYANVQKRGKWFEITSQSGNYYLVKCNKCGDVELNKSYYCPNCGADMRERNKDE